MAQGCLKCLKYTMCAANFLCFMCGVAVLGFGVYLTINFKLAALSPSLAKFSVSNVLLITGIIITCVSFLGFLGALKENRCLLLTFFLLLFFLMLVELTLACLLLMYENEIDTWVTNDLKNGINKGDRKLENSTSSMNEWNILQKWLQCCGVNNMTDWNVVPSSCCKKCNEKESIYWEEGCLDKMKSFFEQNFLHTGISVIMLCIIEVLGMCFAMTLFCHVSRSEIRYKL